MRMIFSLLLQVMVTDPGGLSATADVTIYLTDINDNPPAFNQTSYDFKVRISFLTSSISKWAMERMSLNVTQQMTSTIRRINHGH